MPPNMEDAVVESPADTYFSGITNNRVHALDAGVRLVQGVGDVQHAATVGRIDQRQTLVPEVEYRLRPGS